MALLNSSDSDTVVRKPIQSAQAALSLQELYNRTLRRWEPRVFSGLLASYMSTVSPTASRVYGAATPARDADTTQWINFTPGPVTDSHHAITGAGFTPRGSVSSPFEFRFEPDLRRSSMVRNEGDEQARGIDEILAAMEEGKEAFERALAHTAADQGQMLKNNCNETSRSAEFQLLTPETDGSDDTPLVSASRQGSFHSPESMASPYITASSATASIVSKVLPVVSRRHPPTSLMMPNAKFVPPPPMCMFFSPAFKDLEQGKVGVWKGDLEIRGRGGGKFSVLIVGEQSTGHLW